MDSLNRSGERIRIFYVIGGDIIKPLTFLRFFYSFSASSTPPFRIVVLSFFPNSPPILFSVNRLSIRLLLRISDRLENSNRLKLMFSPLGEQSTIPIRFNNEFGITVNWDPNKQKIIRNETGLLLPFSATVKTILVAFLGLRPVALG